jgi:hypothetical protein
MNKYKQFVTLFLRLTVYINLINHAPLTYALIPSSKVSNFAMISTHAPYQRMNSDEFRLVGTEDHTRIVALFKERIVEGFSDLAPHLQIPGHFHLYLFTPFSVLCPRQLHSLIFIVSVQFDFLLDTYLGEIHHILEEVFHSIDLDIQLYGCDQTTFADLFVDSEQSMKFII